MIRKFGTTRIGSAFPLDVIDAVWQKGTVVPGKDPSRIRKDACGAFIQRDLYGDTTENGLGWEVDHVHPVSKGGSDDISNLQPLQWQNNRAKSDGLLQCPVKAK